MMFFVMKNGVMGTSQDGYLDGTPCAMKVACTVWSRGKARDNIKCLPIAIVNFTNFAVVRFKNRKCCAYLVTGAYLRELKLGGILKPISQNETGNGKWYGGENRKK